MNVSPSYRTAAEVGIPETEQTRIALELMLTQGGVAIMQQIYEAVENKMGRNIYLSQQGKNSLRRVINTRAVESGYIYQYDSNNPGWRITDKGVDFIRKERGKHIGEIKLAARVIINFDLALKEVADLIDFYDEAKQNPSPINSNLEVFKRSGIIVLVTAWESFIEDILLLYVGQKLDRSSSPLEMQKAFNAIAHSWYEAILNKHDNHPKPKDFINWTGDKWKDIVRKKLLEDLANLNSPKSENIGDLSKRYLGEDITVHWVWAGTTSKKACQKLDEIIELRGELAHRIGNYFEARSLAKRDFLISSLKFVARLASRTEEILNSIA